MSREKGEISENTEEVIINHENEGEEVLSGDSSSCTDSDGSYSTEEKLDKLNIPLIQKPFKMDQVISIIRN